jgi:hypothetical protein
MIHLDDIKAFVHSERDSQLHMILPLITTLISGLVIIISVSPEYLRELNPFTLLLLSIASALPIWALNQLLWWHLGRRVSSELTARIVFILNVSGNEKKALSFALSRLMKAIDVMRFIPSKNIANLVTIITIYMGAAISYFYAGSPAMLYGYVLILSLFIWLVCLFVLHRTCKKIDVEPLKAAWEQLKTNDELFRYIDSFMERIEKFVQESAFFHKHEKSVDGSDAAAEHPGQ